MDKMFDHYITKNNKTIINIIYPNELTVIELIKLIIPKLIRDIKIPTTIRLIFFLASFTSAHLDDSIIHIIPL
jgi:hypothetical protein